MKMAQTKIDGHGGTLIIEFDGVVIHFNIFVEIKY